MGIYTPKISPSKLWGKMTSERLFNSFIPPQKTFITPKTNFWLRPCGSEVQKIDFDPNFSLVTKYSGWWLIQNLRTKTKLEISRIRPLKLVDRKSQKKIAKNSGRRPHWPLLELNTPIDPAFYITEIVSKILGRSLAFSTSRSDQKYCTLPWVLAMDRALLF